MSANITSMKFSVFGRGYDDTRADSGDGAVIDVNKYAMGAAYAVFDNTNQYLWIGCFGNGHAKGLLKYDVETFEEEAHTIPTTANEIDGLFHATNIDNNLALVTQGSNWWVFDLTDETIVASGSDSTLANYITWVGTPFDCTLNGTVFQITNVTDGQYYIYSITLDYSDGTVTYTQIGTNRTSGTFVSKDTIYMAYPTTWFYQNRVIEGVSPDGTQVWWRQAPEGGSLGFANVSLNGIGCKGRLYVPTYIYSSWRMGEYNGTRTPDFDTPKPARFFGKFESKPNIKSFVRSNDQKRIAFSTDIGMFCSNFEDLERITETNEKVLAINDSYIVTKLNDFYINVYTY